MRRITAYSELNHGDQITVKFQISKNKWTKGKKATFFTTENLGTGRMMRLKYENKENHNHLYLHAEDVKVLK